MKSNNSNKKKKGSRYPLKLLCSEELKTIISANLIQVNFTTSHEKMHFLKEKSSLSQKFLDRGNVLTRITKFFTKVETFEEVNEEEEMQRRYLIAKKGWKKVRRHYWAFLFLK